MRYLPYIDLTRLNDDDSDISTQSLCQQALAIKGGIAAVCIQPQQVAIAKACLKKSAINIANSC